MSDGEADGPLYLLDGSSLVFRAFYALPEDLATSTGTITNAVHGFVGMVTTLLRDHRPSAMAVAFDLPTPTFRDEKVPTYKGTRAETPEALGPQFDLVHAVLDALGIVRLVAEGFEADDVLATLATAGRDAGRPVVVVSGDRDTFQLVEDPLVRVLYTRRGLSDTVSYDEAGIAERYGVPPARYPMLAALRGDPSDNLPGVPGVGEKTAARLAATYGDLDTLYAHLDDLTPKLRAALAEHEAQVRSNAEVIPLVRQVPLGVGLDDLRLGRWDVEAARRLFGELELRGAWARLEPLLRDGRWSEQGGAHADGPAASTHGGAGPKARATAGGRAGAGGDGRADGDGDRGRSVTAGAAEPGRSGTVVHGDGRPAAGGARAAAAPSGGAKPAVVPPVVVVPAVALVRPSSADEAVAAVRSLAGAASADGARSADGAASAEVVVMAGRWHGDAGRSPLRGVAVARVAVGSDDAAGTGVWLRGDLVAAPSVVAALGDLVGPGRIAVAGHGLKELMRSLLPLGVDVGQVRLDTEVAVGLLDPAAGRRTVDDVVAAWLGRSGASPGGDGRTGGAGDAAAGPRDATVEQTALSLDAGPTADAVPPSGDPTAPSGMGSDGSAPGATGSDGAASGRAVPDGLASGAAADLATADLPAVAGELGAVAATVPVLEAALAAEGLTRLHELVERPLVRVLARMEVVGIGVDVAELQRIADAMAAEGQRLHDEVQRLAGVRFNVNSTPQLREVLFGTLGLKPQRRTKTGYSTDAQTLERLRDAHPVVDTLLRYREVEKLRSTYGTSLLAEVADDGRIHATFHQIGARTGRLSSDRPNLHNIPVRTEEGLALRRAFVAAPGHLLLVADYDQIELRVIAHLAGDPGLRQAFAEGRDVHRATAARVFGVPEEEVTPEQRSRAKMVSYGLAYGMEAYGLAQRLRIGTEEARAILAAYFRAFPAVEAYMAEVVRQARQRGHTETALGRRRPLPDLLSANRGLRQAAERQAMNAAVQGLAADLFKLALVRLDEVLGDPALGGPRLVLQVHDEVVVECPERSADLVEAQVVDVLGGVGAEAGLTVPLVVSTGRGRSWADAKR